MVAVIFGPTLLSLLPISNVPLLIAIADVMPEVAPFMVSSVASPEMLTAVPAELIS